MSQRTERFFGVMADQGLALTFDDVRLKTGYSVVPPDKVSVKSNFSRRVSLNIPVVSAAMDTVTEHEMAIALAKLGGLGIIHRSLSPGEQADQVARVKHYLHGMILKPICVYEDETIEDILARRRKKEYSFHSFLVLDRQEKLVGVLTGNDFDFCTELTLPAARVMTRDVITAREGMSLDEAFALMVEKKRKLLPIVDGDHRVAGLYTFSDAKRIRCDASSIFNVDDRGQLRVGAAVGVGEDALQRAQLLQRENIDVLVIDTAHGDTDPVITTVQQLKASFPDIDVVAGNVTEPESVQRLIDAGADGIKVGQGPGSICTTRIIAGVGCPQVTAVYQCAVVANRKGIPLCADGGIRYSGDITVALAAGAASVMLGSLLAGTKEAPGKTIFYRRRMWKEYYGMGSLKALQKSKSARGRYRQAGSGKDALVPEGVQGRVPYKGELSRSMRQYMGGLRKGMGYVGAATIPELHEKADFMRISAAGQAESHPHDIAITEEAPNYQ